ncbi:MAG: hypothetical protein OHK0022_55960 [Roseiflexaceae bacterium]
MVAGPHAAVEALERLLAGRGLECRRLHTSHAFHSAMMEPVVAPFVELVRRARLSPPQIPFLSNRTGTWITAEQATDPAYWGEHLRQAVRFAGNLAELLAAPEHILLEVGPGNALGGFARRQGGAATVVASMRHPNEHQDDGATMQGALGRLWLAGATVDWAHLSKGQRRRRVPLPTYPFERQRYWIEPGSLSTAFTALAAPERRAELDNWFYAPSWRRAPLAGAATLPAGGQWLVFSAGDGLSTGLVERLRALGQSVACVTTGARFERRGEGEYTLDPHQPAGYSALLDDLRASSQQPGRIIHLWNTGPASFEQAQARGFTSLLALAQALARQDSPGELRIDVVSTGLHEVVGGEALEPEKATLLGPCRVIPQEHPGIACHSIDIVAPASPQGEAALLDRLVAELAAPAPDSVVAYRGAHRWVQSFAQTRLPDPAQRPGLRQHGVYLITGGLGGIGLALAEHLATTCQARLALIGRSALPPRAEWERLAQSSADDRQSAVARRLLAIEQAGGEVLPLRADVTDEDQLRAAVAQTLECFGALHGVIHAAAVAGGGLLLLRTPEQIEQVLAPKVRGTLALDAATRGLPLDFLALFSSLTAVIGELGQIDYCAANAFLDAFAHARAAEGRPVLAINWDTWREIGMAVSADVPVEVRQLREQVLADGILPAEGMAAFERAVAQHGLPQVLISTRDLTARAAHTTALTQALVRAALDQSARPAHARPDLATAYVAPAEGHEQTIAAIWQQLLGIERVGVHDNFFELGGHSLLITQLLNKLTKTYGVDLALRSLFEQPTVAGMAALVAQALGGQTNAKPIGQRVREAAPDERQTLLEDYFRQKVAAALGVAPEHLPVDGDLGGYDLAAAVAELQWNFQQDFRLQVYPNEIPQLTTLAAFAHFTTTELERKASLKQVTHTLPESRYEQYEARLLPAKQAPALRRPARRNPGIAFLHSSPRSGSTLLRVMLAGHRSLFSPPELDILWYEGMRDWRRSLTDADFGHGFHWVSQGLQWTFMELLGLEPEGVRAFMDELVAHNTPIEAVYRRLQELAAPRLLIDKSPSYSLSLDTLRRGEELFEGAKYVHLVRHPYAMIESFLRIRLDKLFGPSIYAGSGVDPYVIAEKVWLVCNRNVRDFFAEIDQERGYVLRYEDLVADPRGKLGELCEFLEIPFDPAVLQPYDNKRERMITGIGDPNILEHSAIDPQLGQAWRQIKLPHRLGAEAARLAEAYGYELPEAVPPQPAESEAAILARILQAVDQLSQDDTRLMLEALGGAAPDER